MILFLFLISRGKMRLKINFVDRIFGLLLSISNSLESIAISVEKIAQLLSQPPFVTFKLSMEELRMAIYKADKPDFDTRVTIDGVDSEGNVVKDIPIPTGFSLSVTSDNPAAFEATQDLTDTQLLHCHVGGPNPDGTNSQSTVTANLFDGGGNMVATGSETVTVTSGDPTAITTISLNLPPN